MNILSIDFDYFQNVTKDKIHLYPDGIDLGTTLSEITWGCKYATDGDAIREIGIMENELDRIENILFNQESSIPVMITNSHVHIYDFINAHIAKEEPLSICNVDMHDDVSNDNKNLDCGNWIGYIMNERKELGLKSSLKWVYNPVSVSVYGIDKEIKQCSNNVFSSLEGIMENKYDAVFLCRSDNWSPPHLDKYFTELCGIIKNHFTSVKMERGIDEPRYEYRKIAEQMKKTTELMKAQRGM